MKQNNSHLPAVLLILALLLTACGAPANQPESTLTPEVTPEVTPASKPETAPETGAQPAVDVETVRNEIAAYLLAKIPEPQVNSVGGEWVVLGLARSGVDIPEGYFDGYYDKAVQFVQERGGVLHAKKYTEYSRVILGLTAIGKDPADVGGYNLLTPLGDYERTVWQGINGPIWALIALDSGAYEIPENPDAEVQASREAYVDNILESQLSDGGWALTGSAADTDLTAMALQALRGYAEQPEVKAAIDRGLECLSAMQDETGGFSSWGVESAESCAQVIVALTSLAIDLNDSRFVKNGCNVMDALLSFRAPEGGFCHTHDGGSDLMATEQAFYALVAVYRAETGQTRLYDMSDIR